MIKRKRRFLWLFRRASFYFIYLNLRSTFDRKPTDLEQVKGHALHAALVISSAVLLTFTNKRSCFLLTAVGHLYTRLSPVSFWGWERWRGKETGTEMGGRWETNVRFVITVIRFFGSGLRNDSDDGCMERKTIHLSHTYILNVLILGGCTLYLSERNQVRPSKMASVITADRIRRDRILISKKMVWNRNGCDSWVSSSRLIFTLVKIRSLLRAPQMSQSARLIIRLLLGGIMKYWRFNKASVYRCGTPMSHAPGDQSPHVQLIKKSSLETSLKMD